MIRWANIILLATLVAKAFSYDDLIIGDLPNDVGEQLTYLLTASFPSIQANCTEIPIPNPTVKYFLYSRENPNEPIELNPLNPVQVDPRRKIVLLVHGWLSNYTFSGIQRLKDEYLKRYNVHLIAVDWDQSARKLYTDAFCDVPYVGENIAEFLCLLHEHFKARLYMVHVIGQGLGGQAIGYVGQHVLTKCNQKMGRLTGLDPFGHLYKNKPVSERLDPSDGDLVDVIHTDGMKLGYGPTCGDVDFHPNCGYYQPGCPSLLGINHESLVTDALCNTLRSLEYMIESVESEDFVAVSCGRCPTYCSPDIVTEVYAIMGENYKPVQPPAHKYLNFFIPTNSSPPYAKGQDPYRLRIDKNLLCKNAAESSPSSLFLRKVCNVH